MRNCAFVVLSGLLSACSAAHSATPDSRNPANCIAAFNYGAYWFKLDHNERGVRNMRVRGSYEMAKWKADGRSKDEAISEAKKITELYAKNDAAMDALFKACGSAQDSDPNFARAQVEIIAAMNSAAR